MSKSVENNKTGSEKAVQKSEVVHDFVVEYRKYTTELTEKFKNRSKWKPADPGKIYSFIPGTITEIFVKEGDAVEPGTAMMVLEAMKMKNTLSSEVSGVLKNIFVELGEKVAKGKVIFEVDLS